MRRRYLPFTLSSVLFSLLPTCLMAQATVSDPLRETIVVTASAVEEEIGQTPAAVTVITRDEIERRKARDLVTVLRQVPGLTAARAGTPGKQTSMFVRGANSVHALVLWNGIEINVPYFGGFDWGQFSTAGVDRVEVVRGPFSALYGSDAVAGVFNVITNARQQGLDVLVEAGEEGLLTGRIDGAWSSDSLRLNAAVDVREDDGFLRNDDFGQTTALVSGSWKGPSGLSLGVAARYNGFELGIPLNVSAAGDAIVPSLRRRQEGSESQLSLPISQQLGRFGWDVTLSRSDRTDEFNDPDDPFGYTSSRTDSTIQRANLVTRTRTALGTIIAGGEWEEARVDDVNAFNLPGEPNIGSETRESKSLFVEDRFSTRFSSGLGLEISAGARWDDYDTFGSELSPRAAAALLTRNGKIRAAWGHGFRAPSVAELYFPWAGNLLLEPETSETWEIGYDHFISPGAMIGATWFDSDYDNLIVYDNATMAFANAGAATSRGVELGGRWEPGTFRASASWTWLDTERRSTGRPLERRPENSGSLSIGWTRGIFAADVVAIHNGRRLDVQPVFPYAHADADPWTTVDLALEAKFGALRPYLKVENLLDEAYEEVLGYPAAPRRALIGVRWSLQ